MNSRSVAIFAVVVAILVGASIWFLNSDSAPHHSDAVNPPATVPKAEQPSPPVSTDPIPEIPVTKPQVKNPPTVTKAVPAEPFTVDDQKIQNALETFPGGTDADNDRTATLLINLLPSLGEKDKQVECAQHITNLISDDSFSKLMPIWRNASFNPDVLQVIGDDLNNRANKVKMPAWVDAVKNPTHPYHDEALGNLTIFLDDLEDEDAKNIPKLERSVKAFLQKEALEEAEAAKEQ